MKYAIGVFVLLPVLLYLPAILITSGGNSQGILPFIHAPSFSTFIIAVSVLLYATGEFKTFVKATNAAFSKKYSISYEDREKGIKLFELISKIITYTAAFSVLVGSILMLGELDFAIEEGFFGPMVSITLIPVFYAVVFKLALIHPAIHVLKNREEKKIVINEREVINKLLELCYKQGVSPNEILEANEITFKKQ